MIEAIMGCWIVAALGIWLFCEAMILSGRIQRWIAKTFPGNATYVDQTINQMYSPTFNAEWKDGADYACTHTLSGKELGSGCRK